MSAVIINDVGAFVSPKAVPAMAGAAYRNIGTGACRLKTMICINTEQWRTR